VDDDDDYDGEEENGKENWNFLVGSARMIETQWDVWQNHIMI
jgi:hypothetical protein